MQRAGRCRTITTIMTYQEFKKSLAAIDKKYNSRRKEVADKIQEMEAKALKEGRITPTDEKELTNLYNEAEFLKNKHDRSIERLKMNFATQNSTIQTGDIIWAQVKGITKVMKVQYRKLSAFDYPMLKFFGTQLTMRGLPAKVQKPYPQGGIYEKDITSINGEPYEYKAHN